MTFARLGICLCLVGFAIQKGEALAAAVGRIAAEEMKIVLDQLRRDGGERVHAARKSLKRLRALLRSMRIALPEEVYCQEYERLSQAGRSISPVRDTHVQLETLRSLDVAQNAAARNLRHTLLNQQSQLARKMPQLRRGVRAMLNASRDQMSSWPLQGATPAGLAAGFRRLYKQARKAAAQAKERPIPENLHHSRKKAKALGYAFELIEDVGPGKISRLTRRTEELTDCLGDDHDLFVLLEALRAENKTQPDDGFGRMANLIAKKRERLQKRALRCGEKIFDRKPAEFEKEILSVLEKSQRKTHD